MVNNSVNRHYIEFRSFWRSNIQDVRKLVVVKLVCRGVFQWFFGRWFESEIECLLLLIIEWHVKCRNIWERRPGDQHKGPQSGPKLRLRSCRGSQFWTVAARRAADMLWGKFFTCDAGLSHTFLSKTFWKIRFGNASATRSKVPNFVASFLSQIWVG